MTIDIDISYTVAQERIFYPQSPKKYTVVTKGRRFGATRGAAQFFIEKALDGAIRLLWGDTINSNIDRYYEIYFYPILKKLPSSLYTWNQQKRMLRIGDCLIDFRSADRPENWEGFGYEIVFLNEAGIILEDDYLYTNAVLPMLLDYSDSRLIAAGVPKGKFKKDGHEHKFYSLYNAAQNDLEGKYELLEFSSFDNPILKKEDIDDLITDIVSTGGNQADIDQEIFGRFTEKTGNNPFLANYDPLKHQAEVSYDPTKQLLIIMDFNINPFALNFAHQWRDGKGEHFHIFDEVDVQAGSIPKVVDLIKERYGNRLNDCRITGDALGKRGDISQRDNATLYDQLLSGLGLRDKNLALVSGNPTHENSRTQCNYVLYHFPDFKINPLTCKSTVRDCKIVQCDAFGSILKRNRKDISQQSDHLDCVRYAINTFLGEWYLRHKRGR